MSQAERPLKKLLRNACDEVFPGISQSVFTNPQFEHAVFELIRGKIAKHEIDLNEFWPEVIADEVEREVKRRDKSPFGKKAMQLSLNILERIPEDAAMDCVIPLGNGERVAWAIAAFQHLGQKQHAQLTKGRETIESAHETGELMQSKVGLWLLNNPTKVLRDGMREFGYWK